jgi:hypothetical protein
MLRRHIACHWSRHGVFNAEATHHLPACQAARLLRNKCAAQRPYVWLHPLAYVTGSRSRGSIESLSERGVGALAVWFGHVSAPDPRLALIKAWVFFSLESWDPTVSSPDPS